MLSTVSVVDSIAEGAMNIPDPSRDRAFLYNEWKPNRPTVVAFVDPLCPYCKKVIPKFDQVTQYNLFVYWAPVFGQRSEEAIRPFFLCEQPTGRAVLNNLVVASVSSSGRASLACEEDVSETGFSDERRATNDEMVASYPINGVPAFFLQGVQVSLSQIQTTHKEPARYINGVAIDWRRYKESRIDWNRAGDSLAIITPEHQTLDLSLQLVEKYRPEYFFSHKDWQAICEALSATACGGGVDLQRARSRQYNEIAALLGVDNRAGETVLLTRGGRLTYLAGKRSDVN
jgi:thiol-disulfide isomerase/thioredoxin